MQSVQYSTVRLTVHLTEHFRGLRRSAGAGPNGCRNEYRTALVAQFDDPAARQVMARFDAFATGGHRPHRREQTEAETARPATSGPSTSETLTGVP